MDKVKNSLIKKIERKNNLNNKKIINPTQRKMFNPNQTNQEDMNIHLKKYQKLNKREAFVDHRVNQNNNVNQKINKKEVFEEDNINMNTHLKSKIKDEMKKEAFVEDNINTLLKKDQEDKKLNHKADLEDNKNNQEKD